MTDFVTSAPGDSPTQGLDEQAPLAPYVPSTAGDVFKSSLFSDSSWLYDQVRKGQAMYGSYDAESGQQLAPPEERLAPDKLKAQFPDVTGIDEPLPLSVVEGMQSQQKAATARASVQTRYPSGIGNTILGFGAGAAASLLDPVDDAAFMVPVVGEARYAQWLGRAGEAAGIVGRGGVTLGVGAARGAVGGAIIAGGRAALGDPDMTLGDVATQTLESGLAGGILHGAFAFRGDVLGRRFAASPDGAAAADDVALHDHATRAAAAQMADGQPVEVRPVFDANRFRQDLLSGTAPPPAPPTGQLDEAVGRAAGQPSNDAMRLDDEAAQARATPPDKVFDGQMAEAERAVADMRQRGLLSQEEEAQLAALTPAEKAAPGEPAKGGQEAAAKPDVQGTLEELQRARAEGRPQTESLFQAIRRAGGVRLRGPDGEYTPEGTVVRQILDRNNSIVNNRRGLYPDALREHLEERGWIDKPDDYQVTDIRELYGMLDREARGDRVFHPESDDAQKVETRRQLDEDMTQAGITGSEPIQQQAQMLAEYRQSARAEIDAWRKAAESAGIDNAQEKSPGEIIEAAAGHENSGENIENWIDQRLESIDPDLADAIRNMESEHGPAEHEPETGLGEGGAGPEAVEGAEGRAGGAGPGPGEGGQLEIPGSERSARQLAAAREAERGGRTGTSVEQQDADVGLFQPPDHQQLLFQRAWRQTERANAPFYSALTRAVEAMPQERAPAAQWAGIIDNLRGKGVKQEEIDWSGVKDWLADQKGAVSKDAVLAHLRDNEVRVQEVEKRGARPVTGAQINEVVRWAGENKPELREQIDDAAMQAAQGHEQALQYLEESGVPNRLLWPFQDKIQFPKDQPKFSSHRLPGGENYRELLLTLPAKDTVTREPSKSPAGWGNTEGGTDGYVELGNNRQDYRSSHWDEPNVLAHIRFDDRIGPNGEKILHMAEVQSDWHQSGRRNGYRGPVDEPALQQKAKDALEAAYAIRDRKVAEIAGGRYANESEAYRAGDNAAAEAIKAIDRTPEFQAAMDRHNEIVAEISRARTVVPDAPFKTTWHELALKRMMRYAAENGYDELSWDTGATQVDRYDLSKQVDSIGYVKRSDGKYEIAAYKDGRREIHEGPIDRSRLVDTVGKDIADKIDAASDDEGEIKGDDLKVGGEGMKGFYDKILPAAANKIGKKFGAKVERGQITGEAEFHVVDDEGQRVVFHDLKEAENYADDHNGEVTWEGIHPSPVHSIDITPAMRESVMQGQPLFQRGEGGAKVPEGTHPFEVAPGLVAHLPDVPTAAEDKILRTVDAMAKRIVPKAEVYAGRGLGLSGDAAQQLGTGEGGAFHGVSAINGARSLIAWSLESPDAVGTVKHEAVHVLRRGGFLNPEEWDTLARAAQDQGWEKQFDIAQRYPEAAQDLRTEEAVAEAFTEWRKSPEWVPLLVRPLFEKMQQLADRVGDFVRRLFGKDATANDVFSRIASGDVGQRTPTDEGADSMAAQHFAEGEEEAMIAARKKLTLMQDLAKRQALVSKVQDVQAQGLTLAHGVDSLTRGISEAVHGARESTAQMQEVRQKEFLGRLTSNLEKIPGGMAAWSKRTETANWVRELAELNKKEGQTGISKSPLALKIAQAVHDAQDLARLKLNQSGAWVGDYEGYVSRTRHDPVAIHKAGYEKWKTDTLAGLDQTRTFADLDADVAETGQDRDEAVDRYMQGLWDALSTGVHLSADRPLSMKEQAFPRGPNLAKRTSAERVLHWKDADAWRVYQEKYGDPVIERGVLSGLMRAGRDAALIEKWGSQPQATFDNLLRQLRETNRGDHAAIAKLDAATPRLKEEFAYLTGEASRPGTSLAWKIRGSIVAAQDISKLGNVLLAHMSVGATKPFQLQYHGIGRWQAYTSVLRNLAQDRTPEGRAIMENLRANATGQFQNLMSGYEALDGVPGTISAIRQFSLRLGGLPWMLARQKSGAEWELSNFLGQNVGKTYDQLEARTRRGLGIYGIGSAEWDALRLAGEHERDGSGSVYLTPAAASRAYVDPMVADRLERAVSFEHEDKIREETRDQLAMKLAAYYSDSADRSTITPGIPERAFFSLHAGRFAGPMVGQYKTWAMAAVRQMWGQAIHGSSRGEAVKSLAELVAVGTAIGYARLALTDGFQGKEPQTFSGDYKKDVPLMSKAMLAGGGLGIFGDYLMGQFSRYSQSGRDRALEFVSNLVGPAVGDVASLYGIGSDIATAAFQKDPQETLQRGGAEMERFIADHTPFVNAFYLKKLAHWLAIDRLNEAANPGYLQRSQDNVKRQTGQDFWLPPTSYAGHQ